MLAAIGFVLSVIAHVFGLLGILPPGGEFAMSLHVGIFVVWLPTVLVANRATKGTKKSDFWKEALLGCPAWMRTALYGVFGYAILNFIYFMAFSNKTKTEGNGISPETIRGFSGHWMVFYGAAFATLYSAIRRPELLKERTCRNGHSVSQSDAYCPQCGAPLSPPYRSTDKS